MIIRAKIQWKQTAAFHRKTTDMGLHIMTNDDYDYITGKMRRAGGKGDGLTAAEVGPPILYCSHLHWAEYDILFIAMMAYQKNQYHYILSKHCKLCIR